MADRENLTRYHLMRGSGSRVLKATGLVSGNRPFSTPCRIDVFRPIAKNVAWVIIYATFNCCAKFGENVPT